MRYAADIGDEFADLLGNVVNIALTVVIFLVIMGLGWLVAAALQRWLAKFLRRVGFDRAVERGGLRRVLGSYSASDLTAKLVAFGFLLFVLQLAFGIFGPNPVSTLIADVIAWLPRLFVAVVIVVVAAAVAGWVHDLIAGALAGLSYGRLLATIAQAVIVALGVIAALNQIGVATTVTLPILITALATVGGILIVGVGGGLVRPMQQRWERILNRAEAESTVAAEHIRTQRAAAKDRDVNAPGGFEQPAYGGTRTTDTKPTTVETPTDHPSS